MLPFIFKKHKIIWTCLGNLDFNENLCLWSSINSFKIQKVHNIKQTHSDMENVNNYVWYAWLNPSIEHLMTPWASKAKSFVAYFYSNYIPAKKKGTIKAPVLDITKISRAKMS